MHEIDLKNKNLRTDLIVEMIDLSKKIDGIKHESKKIDNIIVEETTISKEASNVIGKKNGNYKTISFKDITDKDNYQKVKDIFVKTLKKMLKEENIKESDTCLIVGLGNKASTPDALGPKTLDNILVTKHLFTLGEIEEGYRNVSIFLPGVTGNTGIETRDLIKGVTDVIKPDFLIVVDALAATTIDRLNKTIQMSNAGISPGSGIGNNRKSLDRELLGIPVIAIGVPTIVDAVTIASDTIFYMYKHFSYKLNNLDNKKLKLVPDLLQDYKDFNKDLSLEDKAKVFGMIGSLSEDETKELIYEVLSPINYNLMVTPKEIDFILDKLTSLIGNGINESLHKNFNTIS